MNELAWGDVATWIGSCGAVIAALLAGAISIQLRSRERRQAIASIHADLTTGETAKARDTIGTVLYASGGLQTVGPQEAISAFFKLYWAVQRAENTYRVFNFDPATSKKMNGQQEYFLSWNFREIVQNIVDFHHKYGDQLRIADQDAWQSFKERLRGGHPDLYREFLDHGASADSID